MRSGAVLFGWCEFLAEYIECDVFINDKKKETIKLPSSAPPYIYISKRNRVGDTVANYNLNKLLLTTPEIN